MELYEDNQPFTFHAGQHVVCNGYAGTVIRMYTDTMAEVRVPGGSVCVPSRFPDCFPWPVGLKVKDRHQPIDTTQWLRR